MATVATLTYNAYLRLEFDAYNYRYSGTYPNLRFLADIRCRFLGNFAIQATNTFKFGSLTYSQYMNYGYYTQDSGWFYLGTINEPMYCNRQRSFSYSCSVSGWPNLSGTATVTSDLIGLPSYSASISDVGVTSLTLNGSFTNNPYNLYTIRVYDNNKNTFINNSLQSAAMTFTDLTENTTYSYNVESFMGDCSGTYLESRTLSATTLEAYDIPTITSVDVKVTAASSTTDTVTFTLHTTDDAHIAKSVVIFGSYDSSFSGLTGTVTNVANNTQYTVTSYIVDKLSRVSESYIFTFDSTFTYMEVWTYVNKSGWRRGWRRGYSMELNAMDSKYKLCKLFVFNGTDGVWEEAIAYK